MAIEAPIYDLTLLLDTQAEDERREKILNDVEGLIGKHGGELIGHHEWGVRPTTFEIRKRTDAEYHLIQFHATNELLEALDHTLKITDGVNRFRVIKLRPGTPPPPDNRPGATSSVQLDDDITDDE